MLTPEYLQSVPDAVTELYAQAEADILADMARRINGFDMFIPSADYQMKRLEEMGALRADIVSELSRLTGKSKKELHKIMKAAGVETLKEDEKVYKAAGLTSAPLTSSPAVQEVLAAGLKKTSGLFKNLTKTTANTATRQFEKALDRAYMQITSGAIDPTTAVKRAIKTLAEEGVGAVTYPSGHVDSLEVAVRRAVVTGVNQTCLKVQEARADELGVDLVETTAHAGARPSHAEWQGQIFSRSGKSSKYPDFVRSTGYGTGAGLGGWNCSHSFRPYIEGMPRTYSKELLKSYEAKNYEYNGQKMTEYEALQQQRDIERHIRRWKRENIALKAAGLDASESAVKLTSWQNRQKDFLRQTGLKRQGDREQVAGWGRGQAREASKKAIEYYNKWASVPGFDAPKTLAEYYKIKYTDKKTYDLLRRDHDTLLAISKKDWSPEFKEKAVNAFKQFKAAGVEISDHGLSRVLSRGSSGNGTQTYSIEGVIEQHRMSANFIQDDGRLVKYYSGCAIIENKNGVIVSVVYRKNIKEGWIEYHE